MHPDQSNAPAQPMERDAQMLHEAINTAHEAAERATFHRLEAERWERVGRAAGTAARELQATMPVTQISPDDFLVGGDGKPQMTSMPAGTYVG